MPNIYIVNKGFIYQKMEGKITVFDSEKSMLYTLNATASLIFEKLKKGGTVEEISSFLAKKFRIDVKRALSDVEECIADLTKKKIIK